MEELSYSLHLSNDKNKSKKAKRSVKNTETGTTSLSNNAIQNRQQLSKVDKHNLRKYDDDKELICTIKGTFSIVEDTKNLYLKLFEDARIKYNEKQTRNDRKIENYFNHISNDNKRDLACEIIIELGDMDFWADKDDKFKKNMIEVFKEQIVDLEEFVPNFKIASATIHFDESSPHLHIVGVPFKDGMKNGMEKQVGKSSVFTKESLKTLQNKMRVLCIEYFNKEYNLNDTLKPKLKGRNIDINVNDMDNYTLKKELLDKNQQKLEQANKKSLELKESTKDVKILIKDLKTALTSKDKYILKQEDKDKIINFIDKVDKTNNEYQNIQELSTTLTNVDEELKYNREQINILTENNNSLELRVETLDDKVKTKDDEIKELKEENNVLKTSLENLQRLFDKLIKFLKDRMFNKKEKDKYYDMSYELYKRDIIGRDDMLKIKDNYDKKDKNKDDLEL